MHLGRRAFRHDSWVEDDASGPDVGEVHSDVAITLRVYAGVLPGQERAMVDAFAASLQAAQAQ